MSSAPGSRTINFSEPLTINGRALPAMNPSICRVNNGFLLNVRHVSYSLLPNGEYFSVGGLWLSLNKALWLSKDLIVSRQHVFSGTAKEYPRGLDDVRLLNVENEVHFYGSVLDWPRIRFLYGTYNTHLNHLGGVLIEPHSPFGSTYEKNWAFFRYEKRLYAVYTWSPLRILEFVNNTIVSMEVKDVIQPFFNDMRGTSPGERVGDEIWFVTHITSYGPRNYLHALVALNVKTFEIARHSPLFKFQGELVEFCTGLLVERDRVLFSYGVWDKNALVTTVPISVVDELLERGGKN